MTTIFKKVNDFFKRSVFGEFDEHLTKISKLCEPKETQSKISSYDELDKKIEVIKDLLDSMENNMESFYYKMELDSVINSLDGYALFLDVNCQIIKVSDNFLRDSQFKIEDMIGKTCYELKICECSNFVNVNNKCPIKNKYRNRKNYIRINNILKEEMFGQSFPIHGPDGELYGYIVIFTKSKEEFDKEFLEFISVSHKTKKLIITYNEEDEIIFSNYWCLERLGYSVQELVQKHIWEVITNYNNIKIAINDSGFWFGELELLKKDGEKLKEIAKIKEIRKPSGKILHYIHIGDEL